MLTDILVGFSMLGIISVAVMTTWHQHGKGIHFLEERRVVVRHAEAMLIAMQTSTAEVNQYVEQNGDYDIQFAKADDGNAPKGFAWVKVTVTKGKADASLFGLVPANRFAKGTP